jgi:glycosyltransferase involved in cell wall biosynthesis
MAIDNGALSSPDGTSYPLVSVLVPSYNHEKYVTDCLDSIYNLSYPRLELLVSDDCSQDGTFRLAEQWAHDHADRFERTLIMRQDKNLGIAGNLQYLFDRAKGVYLAYIASDDMFVESAIARRVEFLQQNQNLDGIFGNAQYISESGAVIQEEFISRRRAKIFLKLSSRKLLAAQLVLDWLTPGPVMMIRKAAVCENGSVGRLPDSLKAEDVYIYLRLAAGGKLGFTDCVVAKYRRAPGSMTKELARFDRGLQVLVTSYEMNKHLMKGFNRVALNNKLSRCRLQLNREDAAFYRVRAFILRAITAQLKAAIYLWPAPIRELRKQD